MKRMTRMILISAVFVTSGLTAKIATENYKAATPNNERIHTACENLKTPNKAAVLETIVDATNEEPDERLQKAAVLEPEEPKVIRVKTKVTTSAGVSPIASVMDKKDVNKAEEFIEKVAHPAEVVMEKSLDFTPENIPVQELTYKTKDIFPEFEEVVAEKPLTYMVMLGNGEVDDWGWENYLFNIGTELNGISFESDLLCISKQPISNGTYGIASLTQLWDSSNQSNVLKFDAIKHTIDYKGLIDQKDSSATVQGMRNDSKIPTCKQVYDFLVALEKGECQLLTGLEFDSTL